MSALGPVSAVPGERAPADALMSLYDTHVRDVYGVLNEGVHNAGR